ncbi:hypothetical protein F4802DRAFT_322381 [Xylaria palmicola]|nr:hypothetical protein F4802DRAFT_322381 [Xylaria palmicola]
MKPKQLLHICLLTSSSSALFNDRRLDNIISALYCRRTSNSGRQRHRRASSTPSTPSCNQPGQSPRRRLIGEPSHCRFLERPVRPFAWVDMGLERRLSRASPIATIATVAPVSLDAVVNASSVNLRVEDPAPAPAPTPPPQHGSGEGAEVREDAPTAVETTSSSMPPPQAAPGRETFETRSVRSASSASRNANRLSLTLPIALPNSLSSRPTPTSSMPPTPIDTSALNSPVDSDDIIIAIAAQERRVLELREELTRAEAELKKLQRQWTITEACKKRPPNTAAEPPRALGPPPNLRDSRQDNPAAKRHSELERRKAILLAQSQGTPRQSKRTVFRGNHTRTLSLLSPTRSVGDSSTHEDQDSIRSPDSYISRSPSVDYPLNKRATWAPRQTSARQQHTGVKQLASDFKQGLWTFVEDLRQATVGDEAVSGTTNRTTEMGLRSIKIDGDQDTIRASTANRGRIPFPTELDSALDSPGKSTTSSPSSDHFQHRRTTSRPEPRARKHFSWTPLTFDDIGDDDWASWDSPNVKTSRWSGSTVNGDVPAIPEKADENEIALRKGSTSELQPSCPKSPSRLDELPQAILNRLTPSNIKNTTSNFIKEWEKSLSPPAQTATFDASLQDFTRTTQ